MDATTGDIVAENKKRRAELFADYDPIRGVGSPIDRAPLPWTGGTDVYVPKAMAEKPAVQRLAAEHGTVRRWAKAHNRPTNEALKGFGLFRCRFDFEFWAAAAANIELSAEAREERDTDIAPLVLNRAQRLYFEELWSQWSAGEPVRVILLKARQWGGSTLTQVFFAWVQRFHREAWNSFICSRTDDQARNIRRMYTRLAERYPAELGDITLRPFEGSSKVRQIEETESIIGVSSIESKDSIRTYDIHLAHLSEVGFWPSTPEVNAEDYASGITGAVSNVPGTVVVEESTARGVGTYFHNHWQSAQKGKSSYEPVFIAWHDIPKYHREIGDPEAFVRDQLRPSSAPENPAEGDLPESVELARRLWRVGATLGGIKWYKAKLAEFKGDIRQMQREYPSAPTEAFQSTGRRFFTLDLTAKVRSQTTEPTATGRLSAGAETGPEALDEIAFRKSREGRLKVWRRPSDKVWWDGELLTPEEARFTRRFCAFVDFGGKTQDADWSVMTVADRIKMLRGGPAEVVARLHCHMRPDLFAWASARLGAWYHDALLAYEINRHKSGRGDDIRGYEPEWSLAVIKQVEDHYPNLYYRKRQERIDEKLQLEVGFHMNQSTKPMIYNALDAGLSAEPGGQVYFDPDVDFADELDTFERKEDGRLGAVAGNHDDVADSSAGTAWLALKHMEPPARVDGQPDRPARPEPGASQFQTSARRY